MWMFITLLLTVASAEKKVPIEDEESDSGEEEQYEDENQEFEKDEDDILKDESADPEKQFDSHPPGKVQ
ncbi:hypothetical protein QQG55_14170 [Brugia pahangi]|uniref:Secreted phosphoprotein 1 n=2 Tax=Brugia TaxID=6278 RepID=A0A0N4T200_BRUPA|nr:unnamed protein product [Brugia pahangi]